MTDARDAIFDHQGGVTAPWYQPQELSDEKREFFRETALRARASKLAGLERPAASDVVLHRPALKPADLMPRVAPHLLPALSLFSGGGGLDLAFERAGFAHVASYDTLEAGGDTLRANRPDWTVKSGADGDVRDIDWRPYRGELAVLHGGPPCQPFSVAGRQRGHEDERNLLPEFVRAVGITRPLAFVCENVPALAGPKFASYLRDHFLGPLSRNYHVASFRLSAHDFGVPQLRHRVFFVGFGRDEHRRRFEEPAATHSADHLRGGQPKLFPSAAFGLARTMGVREALGLPAIGRDALAPTIRSTLTGPRHTTSILSSVAAQKAWSAIQVWPNGVARSRLSASRFPTANGHVRLSVSDCAVLQGFPSWWAFPGAVYKALGQIGNSVAPPVGYRVALAVAVALGFGPAR